MNQFSNKYNEDDYKNKCIEFNVEYIGNHKEKKKGTIIDFICPQHKDKGIQSINWSHFKNKKCACSYCKGRGKTTEEFHTEIKNQNIIFLSEYLGCEKPLKCRCGDCGYIWTTNRPIDLKRRNGCPICGEKLKGLSRMKSQDEFESDLKNQNPNIKIIGKYQGSHKLIKCKCLIDNYEWESYGSNLLNGSAGCPICNNSIGENAIILTLEKWGYKYKTQYTFPNCKDKHVLKFDVYDVDNNILIEFQGEQHYYPIDFSGQGKDSAQEAFKQLQKRDNIKKKYCKDNNLSLICIPYWERDNVEDFLIKQYEKIRKELA